MKNDREWIVPLKPVPDADRVVRAVGLALPAPQRAARVTELRRQVRDGYFATDTMMDVVARRIIESGDL